MSRITCFDSRGNPINYLTQWDVNQDLYIEDWEYNNPPSFHFCNVKSENSLVVQGEFVDGKVKSKIPNVLLQEPYAITISVYLEENKVTQDGNSTSGRSIYTFQMPVRKKPKPDRYEYEENVEYANYYLLKKEMNEQIGNARLEWQNNIETYLNAEVIDYVNELEYQRDLLASILSAHGVDASKDEKFNTLIPKINDISTGGGMGGDIQFSDHNMLLDVDFFNSSYAACVKGDKFVNVTFIKLTSSMGPWFSLTGKIPFNTKKYYKISVNNSWTGYGRLGINKRYTSSYSSGDSNSPFGRSGSKCGLNAIGDFDGAVKSYNDGDCHVFQKNSTGDKIFRIIPSSYNSLTVGGSLWMCSLDNYYGATLDEFSIELALYEQI